MFVLYLIVLAQALLLVQRVSPPRLTQIATPPWYSARFLEFARILSARDHLMEALDLIASTHRRTFSFRRANVLNSVVVTEDHLLLMRGDIDDAIEHLTLAREQLRNPQAAPFRIRPTQPAPS
jgi:hypothetical protein